MNKIFMRIHYLKFLVLLLISTILSACSLLLPAKAYNPTLFRLNPISITAPLPPLVHKTHLSILILPSVASPEFNTSKMAYVTAKHQIAYYAENRWVAMPSEMLLPLIAQALRKSGHFYAVIPAPFAGSTDLILYTQLLQLEQDYTTSPSSVRMTLAAQIVDAKTNKIIAAHQFSSVISASENNSAGGAIAANEATAEILEELTAFCGHVE